MKTGILFDLDGTLLDTLEDLTDATNYTLRHYHKPERKIEEMRKIIGSGALFQITTALNGDDKDLDMQEVLKFYRAYYDTHSRVKTRPYAGVLEALSVLKEKYPIGIVSNKPDVVVKELCADFFPGIYALGECMEIRPKKPAPDMLCKAMSDLGIDRCIYVGDTEIDVETARNTGVPCLCVLWGFRDPDELEQAGGKTFCRHPEDLPQIIAEMTK